VGADDFKRNSCQWLQPAHEPLEQLAQLPPDDPQLQEPPEEEPPMLKALIRRSVLTHPQSGQGGFLTRELRSSSSKTPAHRGHSNS